MTDQQPSTSLTRFEHDGTTLWQLGGRRRDRIQPDGSWDVQVTGGRYACRTSDTQAVLTCGECGQEAIIQRRDGTRLSDDDIVTELRRGIEHDCTPATTA